MIKVTEGALWALFFIIRLSTVSSNHNDCTNLSEDPYSVTAKDFKISRRDVKSLFCNAFFCSNTLEPIKLLLNNYIHVKSYTTRVYSGIHTVDPSKNCSSCQTDTFPVKEENSMCEVCPSVPESRSIEIHIRIDKPSEANVNGDFCQFQNFFNITMLRLQKAENETIYCKDGHNISLPVDEVVCNISNKSKLQQACIKPSCFDGIKSESIATGNILHQFPESKTRELCIFNIKSDFKPVEIFYSPNIKESLVIYGETLDRPKFNLANCDDSSSRIMINTTASSFYIVYNNEGELHEKGSLSIIAVQENLCSNLPLVENGMAEVVIENKAQLLQFKCNEGFAIAGNKKLNCDASAKKNVPICVNIDKDKEHDSTSQKIINESLQDATTTLASVFAQNSTNTSVEGSGRIMEYDSGSGFLDSEYEDGYFNFTSSFNASADTSNFDLKLFTLPTFKDNMLIFILIGVGFCLIIIITIVSAVVFSKNGSCRSHSGRKFDTFQNPIYEKPVHVRVAADNGELCHEKIDLADLSDCTVLE